MLYEYETGPGIFVNNPYDVRDNGKFLMVLLEFRDSFHCPVTGYIGEEWLVLSQHKETGNCFTWRCIL